jgi:hypothetical protein
MRRHGVRIPRHADAGFRTIRSAGGSPATMPGSPLLGPVSLLSGRFELPLVNGGNTRPIRTSSRPITSHTRRASSAFPTTQPSHAVSD